MPLGRFGYLKSFANVCFPLPCCHHFDTDSQFDAFVLGCQPLSFLRLLRLLIPQLYNRLETIKPHLVERMREETVAKTILSHLEGLWDPILVNPRALSVCFDGFCGSQDPGLLQSCCFLAIVSLEINCNTIAHHSPIKSLLGHFYSLASPTAFSSTRQCLSQIIARQEAIWLQHFSSVEVASPKLVEEHVEGLNRGSVRALSLQSSAPRGEMLDENHLGNWLTDLGSPRWMAFTGPSDWNGWLESVKGLLAECSVNGKDLD